MFDFFKYYKSMTGGTVNPIPILYEFYYIFT